MALAAGLCLLTVLVLVNCDTRTPSGSGGGTTANVAEVELQIPSEFKAPSGPLDVTINAIAIELSEKEKELLWLGMSICRCIRRRWT